MGTPEQTDVKLRPARREDAKAAAAIAAEVFEGVALEHLIEQRCGKLRGTTWQERKGDEVMREIEGAPEWAIVAETAGELVGFVTTVLNERTGVGRILNVAVARRWQGRGIGRRLLEAACQMLQERGAEYLQIETLETNPIGQRLYPKLGFREIARKIYYFMEVGKCRERR